MGAPIGNQRAGRGKANQTDRDELGRRREGVRGELEALWYFLTQGTPTLCYLEGDSL